MICYCNCHVPNFLPNILRNSVITVTVKSSFNKIQSTRLPDLFIYHVKRTFMFICFDYKGIQLFFFFFSNFSKELLMKMIIVNNIVVKPN